MGENIENDSSVLNLDSSKEIEIKNEKAGIDKDESAQNTLSTVSHLSKDQEEEVKKLLKKELNDATINLNENIKKEGQDVKKDFIIIFGLFASFVTFLSIEVQIFKNKEIVSELIGISSMTLAFILFFAIVINDITRENNTWKDFFKPIQIFMLVFLLIGLYFLNIGREENSLHSKIEKVLKTDSLLMEQINVKLSNENIDTIKVDSSNILKKGSKTPSH